MRINKGFKLVTAELNEIFNLASRFKTIKVLKRVLIHSFHLPKFLTVKKRKLCYFMIYLF
jgi:hypothetical protein